MNKIIFINKLPNIIVFIVFVSYVFNTYINRFSEIRFLHLIQILAGFLLWVLLFFIKNSKFSRILIARDEMFFLIYWILFGFLLNISSLYSVDPYYSFFRINFTILLFFVMFIYFSCLYNILSYNKKARNLYILSINVIFLISIYGNFMIEDWIRGSGRLSGGINPNHLAAYAFLQIFLVHHISLKDRWNFKLKISWFLGLIVLFWTGSGTMIVALLSSYFIFYFIDNIICFLLKHRLKIWNTFMTITPVILLFLFAIVLFDIVEFDFANIDLTSIFRQENVIRRLEIWQVSIDYFYDNVIFGSAGWWMTAQILGEAMDTSGTHNLYIRLLAEVGLIGTLIVLIFPAYILYRNIKLYAKTKFPLYLLNFAFVFGVFISQLAEDRYLTGSGGFGHGMIMIVLIFSLLSTKPTK